LVFVSTHAALEDCAAALPSLACLWIDGLILSQPAAVTKNNVKLAGFSLGHRFLAPVGAHVFSVPGGLYRLPMWRQSTERASLSTMKHQKSFSATTTAIVVRRFLASFLSFSAVFAATLICTVSPPVGENLPRPRCFGVTSAVICCATGSQNAANSQRVLTVNERKV
jgi:hypothetical protein